ncbi:hypothetical protein TWF569_007936 [Orbilia oligospora]|uniref:CBM1 domain-containing protein n=1 Tax=Orbilia oligospora TaxID=2813651 RepID=A0A7C8JPX2_ORBOL|nr:hypothetical protein TWF102_000363 [Orbilia oligospora]KAF3113819.1 hypothetical protein TWF706_009189 [Orbilia oligospora]KAF3115935.1 hypothetical protein TWF103_010164 [Orbilia oligospora]KAF3138241.1 hypothetical protein TWF703_004770 [Orbilia oligospora]KAF3149632.1 hypothetical protein TWF594_010733 [Orbilia oligospora]
MVTKVLFGLALAAAVNAQAQPYAQCGGSGFTGSTTCVSGWTCVYSSEWYSQCLQSTGTTAATTKTTTKSTTTSTKTTTAVTTTKTTTTKASTTLATSTTKTTSQPAASGSCIAQCTVGYCTQNGGTTGGIGGTVTTVSTLDALVSALNNDNPKIVYISGTISGNQQVDVGSNTHVIGKSGSQLIGVGLRAWRRKNIVFANLRISKCLAPIDNILIQETTNVLVDHCDLSSDQDHDKDYYDGALDMSHATDFVTVSNTFIHDHYKCSLIGHSDNNAAEDTGHLRVTYLRNRWSNCNSRQPSVRFGTVHVVNNYFENSSLGYTSRMGAQMLVEYSKWVNVASIDYEESKTTGYVVTRGNDYGTGKTPILPVGTLSSVPYSYTTLAVGDVDSYTSANAGQKLSC